METQAPFCPVELRQITDQILSSRRITRKDQSLLMRLVMNTALGEQEQNWINRIYDDLRRGFIRVID